MYLVVKSFEKLANIFGFLGYIYRETCRSLVEGEIKTAKITKTDKVLHVGCGAVPYTSQIIAETGADVTAIDVDPVAVKKARSLVNGSRVKIELANGNKFPFSDFDVVVVSHGVRPKNEILGKIYDSLKDGSRLVYRNPKGLVGSLYNEESVDFPEGRKIKHNWILFRESVVVEK